MNEVENEALSEAQLQRFLDEHYSMDLNSIICPGNGREPTREAVRDAFFDGVRVGWRNARAAQPEPDDGDLSASPSPTAGGP